MSTSTPLTVRDLIAELSKHSPDRVVILASDSEGNDYHVLSQYSSISALAYKRGGRHGIEIGVEKVEEGYADEVLEGGKPALVIYP